MFNSWVCRLCHCLEQHLEVHPVRSNLMEPLEDRRLLTVVTWSDSAVTTLSGYALYGAIQAGSNGTGGSNAGTIVGTDVEPVASAMVTWDSNPANGFDSGWRSLTFTVDLTTSTGEVSWDLARVTSLQYSGDIGSTISKVTLQAAVTGPDRAMTWNQAIVQFYRQGSLVEAIDVGGDVVATTMGATGSAESVAEITPTYSDCDKMTVTARARIQATNWYTATVDDFFGKILIYT